MDLVKSIQSILYERVSSPLAGMFLMSWAVIHYDLVMMLMSKNDMFYKTQIIYEYMVIDAKYNWGGWPLINAAPYWHGLFKPLLYSFVALISYSIISPLAFSISSWSTHRLQLTRRKYDKKTPVPAEKLIEIQNKFDKQTDEYRENILRHEVEIDSHKKINQEVNTTNIDLKNTIEELTGSLKDIQGRGEQALETIKEKHHALILEKEELSVVIKQLKKDNEILADKYEELSARDKLGESASGISPEGSATNESNTAKSMSKYQGDVVANHAATFGVSAAEHVKRVTEPSGALEVMGAMKADQYENAKRVAEISKAADVISAENARRVAGISRSADVISAEHANRIAGISRSANVISAENANRIAGIPNAAKVGSAVERIVSQNDLYKTLPFTSVSETLGLDVGVNNSLWRPELMGGLKEYEHLNNIVSGFNHPVLNHPLMDILEQYKKMGIM